MEMPNLKCVGSGEGKTEESRKFEIKVKDKFASKEKKKDNKKERKKDIKKGSKQNNT